MRLTSMMLGVGLVALISGGARAADRATSSDSLGEVNFAFDSSVLPDNAAALLADVVQYASLHPATRVVLDAHCDPIGTSPYNVGLAIRRAESTKTELTALGVPPEQIVLAIYGKEGARRATYAEDRRVTVWPTREPLDTVADATFDREGHALVWGEPLTTAQTEAPPEPVATR